jgi:hypothetical protein
MNNTERDKYISSMRKYSEHLKANPSKRKQLLIKAGIIDKKGKLTDMYKNPNSTND